MDDHPQISGRMGSYLAELYRLGGVETVVSPSDLAHALGVTPAAVARMVRRLEGRNLVTRVPGRGVQLTKSGRYEALRSIRSHRMSESFLVRVMGYGWHEAHDLADALSEIANDEFVDRMAEKAGNPTRCPHGEPIPSREGVVEELMDCPLSEVEVGAGGILSRVRTREAEKLIYLQEVGLLPGTPLRVQGKGPFRGPIRILVEEVELVLGADLAAELFVQV